MSFKISNEDQTVKIYNLRSDTNEFIGAGDAFVVAHTGLPANSTDIKPPEIKSGKVAVFDLNEKTWSLVDDFRGNVVIDISTQAEILITELGALPENTTMLLPNGPYKKWNGEAWEDDSVAMAAGYQIKIEEDRQSILTDAYAVTDDWRTELMLGEISDTDKQSLSKWMAYIKQVKNLDLSSVIDEESYSEFKWPENP